MAVDNGDDPSFYQARHGNPLTWGVCRQNVRNAVQNDDIVVFISFTKVSNRIVYRLCSVATVAAKMDHRYVWDDPRFKGKAYINVLIQTDPNEERWIHAENDRRRGARHKDWLWRIADQRGMKQEQFNRELRAIYEQDWFSNAEVAHASQGSRETWTNEYLKQAVFGCVTDGTRRNIRTTNPSIAHPHIRWSLEFDKEEPWLLVLRGRTNPTESTSR
jgi:hypothetical protein